MSTSSSEIKVLRSNNTFVWCDRFTFFIIGVLIMLGIFQAYSLYRTNYRGEQMAICLTEFRHNAKDIINAMTWEDFFQEFANRGMALRYNSTEKQCEFNLKG